MITYDDISQINLLLKAIRDGDTGSVDLLYDYVGANLRYIALKYLKNDADADDLVQDFWADIYKISDKFFYIQNGYGYLCKVMTHMAINRYKKLHLHTAVSISAVDFNIEDSAAHVELENVANAILVEKALKCLDEKEQIIIQETFFEDKAVRAVAKDVQLSKSQVQRKKNKAIEKMKEYIESNRDKAVQ